jgi:hypothetical protein
MAFELDDKEIDSRLTAARTAQERSRLAFITSTVLSLALIGLTYNSYVSIYRQFAFDHYYQKILDLKPDEEGVRTKIMQEKLMHEWVSSRFITFAPLGIRFGVGDAPVLGGFALLIVTSWYFFVARRENFSITVLLRDTWNTEDDVKRWKVFNDINSYTIFTNVLHSNRSIRDLTQPTPTDMVDRQDLWFRIVRVISNYCLHFLPLISQVTVFTFEILSAFSVIRSPFRDPPTAPLYPAVWQFLIWIIPVLLVVMIAHNNFKVIKYASGTERVLRQFHHNLQLVAERPGFVPAKGMLDPDKKGCPLPSYSLTDSHVEIAPTISKVLDNPPSPSRSDETQETVEKYKV